MMGKLIVGGAVVVGAAFGGWVMHLVDARRVADADVRVSAAVVETERARRATAVLVASSAHAAAGRQFAMQFKVTTAEQHLMAEKKRYETALSHLRRALLTGDERVRVAVRNCSPSGGGDRPLRGAAIASGVGDGAAAEADLGGATAGRVFDVAGDDDAEIRKVRVLQAYACTVQPRNPGCLGRNAKANSMIMTRD
ncbi:MAG: lysis system i-spanin subunit Rz [Janthinobacterium lividum]